MFKSTIAALFALLLLAPSTVRADGDTDGCVSPQEVLQYFISPPEPWADMRPVGSLRGDAARSFLTGLRFPGVVSNVEIVIAFTSNANTPGRVFVVPFNADGCGLMSNGGQASNNPSATGGRNVPAGAWLPRAIWNTANGLGA